MLDLESEEAESSPGRDVNKGPRGFLMGIPAVRKVVRLLRRRMKPFRGSTHYWQERYASGGNSGPGSYAKLAEFKARVLNGLVVELAATSVIEFGCGDGGQLSLAHYPRYLGIDVSPIAVARCRERFRGDPTKTFALLGDYRGEIADLALSLDVIYHLVEQDVYESHLKTLFGSSDRHVIVYSSDSNRNSILEGAHVKHRRFTNWVIENAPDWKLVRRIPNEYPSRLGGGKGSFADFFVFEKAFTQPDPKVGSWS